jgi:cysteinyl-tRNA synthetase
MDLQFPHHECEIAQNTIAHGHGPAKYWMHNNMITIDGKKMGKSYNNVIKLTELFTGNHPLLEKAYHPMTIRFNILQTHYRSPMDFSNSSLKASEIALRRLMETHNTLKSLKGTNSVNSDINSKLENLCKECEDYMNNDFSTASVLANLFEMSKYINGCKSGVYKLSLHIINLMIKTFDLYVFDILGLKSFEEKSDINDELISLVIELRNSFRKQKNFEQSDEIRNKLQNIGIQLKDEKDGSITYNFIHNEN